MTRELTREELDNVLAGEQEGGLSPATARRFIEHIRSTDEHLTAERTAREKAEHDLDRCLGAIKTAAARIVELEREAAAKEE